MTDMPTLRYQDDVISMIERIRNGETHGSVAVGPVVVFGRRSSHLSCPSVLLSVERSGVHGAFHFFEGNPFIEEAARHILRIANDTITQHRLEQRNAAPQE